MVYFTYYICFIPIIYIWQTINCTYLKCTLWIWCCQWLPSQVHEESLPLVETERVRPTERGKQRQTRKERQRWGRVQRDKRQEGRKWERKQYYSLCQNKNSSLDFPVLEANLLSPSLFLSLFLKLVSLRFLNLQVTDYKPSPIISSSLSPIQNLLIQILSEQCKVFWIFQRREKNRRLTRYIHSTQPANPRGGFLSLSVPVLQRWFLLILPPHSLQPLASFCYTEQYSNHLLSRAFSWGSDFYSK